MQTGEGSGTPGRGQGDLAPLRAYLRRKMHQARVSMRALSLALGRDPSYIAQLLDPRQRRALPTPAELQLVASLLDAPFGELLELTWGVRIADLCAELLAGGPHPDPLEGALAGLSAAEQAEIAEFAAFLKWRRADRAAADDAVRYPRSRAKVPQDDPS